MKYLKSIFVILLSLATAIVLAACVSDATNTENHTDEVSDSFPIADKETPETVYYSVSTTAEDNHGLAGSYTKLTNKNIALGETVTLTASVNKGYTFDGWYMLINSGWFEERVLMSDDLEYTFTMTEKETSNVTYMAVFSYYTVSTYSHSDDYGVAGSYTKLEDTKYTVGEAVTLEATVNEGYNFEGWYEDGVCVEDDLIHTFVMDKANKTLEARYSYYTFTTQGWDDEYGVAGSYTKFEDKKISVGETVTVEATVNEGYNFEGWYENGVCVEDDLIHTFVMDKESKTLSARYSYYTFTTQGWDDEYGVAGSYTKFEDKRISAGETVTLEATVNEGYNFEGWYESDICIETDLTYTFVMDKTSRTVAARYSHYAVTTFSGSDDYGVAGSYTKLENKNISAGETVTLEATVNAGYNFEGWFNGGVCVCKDLVYEFEMKKQYEDIEARYSYYTVSTRTDSDDGGAAGSYTKLEDKKISIGETVTVKATVNRGYEFIGWHIGNFLICTDTTYTFVMENESIVLYAQYRSIE